MNLMKSAFVTLLIFFGLFSTFGQETFTFRGHPWGESIEEFIQQEGQPGTHWTKAQGAKILGSDNLRYSDKKVAGYSAMIEAEFDSSGLLAGSYSFDLDQSDLFTGDKNPKYFINAYIDLQQKLSSLYGDPVQKDDLEVIEGEISALLAGRYSGHAPYVTKWEYQKNGIWLQLIYNKQWNLYLLYLSPELLAQFKAADEEQANSTEGL